MRWSGRASLPPGLKGAARFTVSSDREKGSASRLVMSLENSSFLLKGQFTCHCLMHALWVHAWICAQHMDLCPELLVVTPCAAVCRVCVLHLKILLRPLCQPAVPCSVMGGHLLFSEASSIQAHEQLQMPGKPPTFLCQVQRWAMWMSSETLPAYAVSALSCRHVSLLVWCMPLSAKPEPTCNARNGTSVSLGAKHRFSAVSTFMPVASESPPPSGAQCALLGLWHLRLV